MKRTLLSLFIAGSLSANAQVPGNIPTDGLVAWYSLANNATDGSASGLNGSGISTSGAVDHNGVTNGAMGFSGFSYVMVPTNSAFNTGNEMTVTAWVNLADAMANQKIIGRTNVSFNTGFILGVGNGQINPELWDANGVAHSFSAGSIASNAWVHLAITWSGSGDLIAYINGVAVQSAAGSGAGMGTNSEPLIIGGSPWSQSPLYFPVSGSIDDIGIWDRALTADEVDDVMTPSGVGILEATTAPTTLFHDAIQQRIVINMPDFTSKQYTIVNALGAVVMNGRLNTGSTSIPVSALNSGAYFVRLDGTGTSVLRFVKN